MENNTKGTVKKMTETQRKLAEENYGLIGGFCNLYNLNSDDYSDILSLALCESAMRYDASKGIAFSTYTYQIMNNRMIDEYRKTQSREVIPRDMIISENDLVVDDNYHDITVPINELGEYSLYFNRKKCWSRYAFICIITYCIIGCNV